MGMHPLWLGRLKTKENKSKMYINPNTNRQAKNRSEERRRLQVYMAQSIENKTCPNCGEKGLIRSNPFTWACRNSNCNWCQVKKENVDGN